MPSGGKRNGSGRPKGAINLAMRDVLSAASASGEMPIAYMLRVMRNEKAPDLRRDEMAKMAATYLHTKLASIPSEDLDALELAPAPDEPAGGAATSEEQKNEQ